MHGPSTPFPIDPRRDGGGAPPGVRGVAMPTCDRGGYRIGLKDGVAGSAILRGSQ